MKRLIAIVIAGFAAAAAFSAVASSASHSQRLAGLSHDLPAFLHYHPTDGNPMRP